MERYNFQKIEKKWREKHEQLSVKNEKNQKKILLFRNVSISFRKNSYGTREKLHNRRCNS